MMRLEAKITGRVQGVMYRDFAQRKAKKLGVVGTVQNMQDGSVRIVAEGEETVLKKYLEEYLCKGPLFAKIENIETAWSAATGEFQDFEILI